MQRFNYTPYKIKIAGITEGIKVLKFIGTEEINKPYKYIINFISSNNNLDLDSLIFNNIVLEISSSTTKDDVFYINGICKSIKTKGFFLDEYIYEITLVPKIWRLSLQHSSKVHLNVSITDLIKNYMNTNNFSEKIDYELKLREDYKKLELVCQYNESDLNFLTRWLEIYGIYYYFINDNNNEKIIFTDNNSCHKDIKQKDLNYTNIDYQVQDNKDTNIFEFNLELFAANTAFIHDHYDGTRKKISTNDASSSEYEYDMALRLYGGNPQIQDSYDKFDLLEEERITSHKFRGTGKSSVVSMHIGGTFILNSKFKTINKKFLIKKLIHKGDQTQFLKEKNLIQNEKLYQNYFEVVPYNIQYRPKKTKNKPYFYGLLNGTIDGISENKPLVDKLGRYKVILPFDTLKKEKGKNSIPIRVAQPSASNEKSGMHFKLLKGDEVIIGFREGDIDRPIILGAVNNKSQVSNDLKVDEIRRVDTCISLDDKYLKIVTPQKIEIIGI
jgi:type VI secretion system secreted protein VgrG